MFTNVEGEWDEVMALLKACVDRVAVDAPRVSVVVKERFWEEKAEALSYLDRCLDAGFRPGMGNVVPDRLFWAQAEGEDAGELTKEEAQALQVLDMPANETKH